MRVDWRELGLHSGMSVQVGDIAERLERTIGLVASLGERDQSGCSHVLLDEVAVDGYRILVMVALVCSAPGRDFLPNFVAIGH